MTILSTIEAMAVNLGLPRGGSPPRKDPGLVDVIRQAADSLRPLADSALRDRTHELRTASQNGASPVSDSHLVPACALVTEAARRTLGICYYDVQLLAGVTLARGKVAQMQTGEGKTFVAALPAFVHGLTGKGVHVMTVNDYLAERDFELIAPVFELLGMSNACLHASSPTEAKQAAYACDITYGPGYEFGFDYLRDQAALHARGKPRLGERTRSRLRGDRQPSNQSTQRGFAFCVIDEIDSVLLDEATTPLLLSQGGSASAATEVYHLAKQTAAQLLEQRDFIVARRTSGVTLTEKGVAAIAADGSRAAEHGLLRPWSLYVTQALHAQLILQRDVDYVIDDGKVQLVDQNTGRIFADRSWRDGLHQAVEAKEDLAISPKQRPFGSITRQRFFGLYDQMSGMTGTATGNEQEFQHFYRLPIVVIPTRKANLRRQLRSRFFVSIDAKFRAVTEEVRRIHATGQPILLGTQTIVASEQLAELLRAAELPFQLLNGKQDEEEANIVAGAGQRDAITIATNMAGRGTDIGLGDGVAELGGLHVIGTEHHASPRVDRQLVGRGARQGDPGSYQFFVSAEDELIASQAPTLSRRMQMDANNNGELSRDYAGDIRRLQQRMERLSYRQRQQMFAHDKWLEGVMATLAADQSG